VLAAEFFDPSALPAGLLDAHRELIAMALDGIGNGFAAGHQ
jgi:hypothetical protein